MCRIINLHTPYHAFSVRRSGDENHTLLRLARLWKNVGGSPLVAPKFFTLWSKQRKNFTDRLRHEKGGLPSNTQGFKRSVRPICRCGHQGMRAPTKCDN